MMFVYRIWTTHRQRVLLIELKETVMESERPGQRENANEPRGQSVFTFATSVRVSIPFQSSRQLPMARFSWRSIRSVLDQIPLSAAYIQQPVASLMSSFWLPMLPGTLAPAAS
jgi:hypothetical protein